MANFWYNTGPSGLQNGAFDMDAGGQTFRILVATSAYSPAAGHNFVDDITNELSGGSYARKDLTTRSVTVANPSEFIADNVSWTGLTNGQTGKWVVVYRFVTNDADSPLILALDITAVVFTGDITLKWNGGVASGRLWQATGS